MNGKSKNSKSYRYGTELAKADIAAGLPQNITYAESCDITRAGGVSHRREWRQPRGLYASGIEQGYQDTFARAYEALGHAAAHCKWGSAPTDRQPDEADLQAAKILTDLRSQIAREKAQ